MDYRPGDELPAAGEPDERAQDWLVLRTAEGTPQLAFQYVEQLARPTWPTGEVPQQLHLDLSVSSVEELELQHERVLALGGRYLSDNTHAGDDEPFRVYTDPAGHPFCIFVTQRAV
ncbi:VOC family protein [Kribbella sp. NPDC023972]|uniref:VOC family protein n=1 Tax=Kribbella sp. NPDC023972 TaxID=3154795 RepID=UPI00340942B0